MRMIGRSVTRRAAAGRLLVNGLLYNRPVRIVHPCELRFVSEGHALFFIAVQA